MRHHDFYYLCRCDVSLQLESIFFVMRKIAAPLLLLAFVFPGCQGTGSNGTVGQTSDGVTVSLREIQNDVVYFDIRNISSQDIFELQLEISYFDESGNAIKIDTVSYAMTADSAGVREPFLKSGSETFIVQSIQPGTTRTSARHID